MKKSVKMSAATRRAAFGNVLVICEGVAYLLSTRAFIHGRKVAYNATKPHKWHGSPTWLFKCEYFGNGVPNFNRSKLTDHFNERTSFGMSWGQGVQEKCRAICNAHGFKYEAVNAIQAVSLSNFNLEAALALNDTIRPHPLGNKGEAKVHYSLTQTVLPFTGQSPKRIHWGVKETRTLWPNKGIVTADDNDIYNAVRRKFETQLAKWATARLARLDKTHLVYCNIGGEVWERPKVKIASMDAYGVPSLEERYAENIDASGDIVPTTA
jgi:hypothetical protein